MRKNKIPYSFIIKRYLPTWSEINMAIKEGWIEHNFAIDYAIAQLEKDSEDEDEIQIAGLLRGQEICITEIISRLCLKDSGFDEEKSKIRWLRLILAWIFENKRSYSEPLDILENLYVDFGYPKEIKHLIRFNIPTDGYSPQGHTEEENIKRIYRLWGEYIDNYIPVSN